MAKAPSKLSRAILGGGDLQPLFDTLKKKGYRVIGPTVRDGTIVLDELSEARELPHGWTDEQAGGHYRLHKRNDSAKFGFNTGPQSAKGYLHAPQAILWRGKREGFAKVESDHVPPKFAFLGLKPCDVSSIVLQDEILMRGPFGDSLYSARRKNILIIVTNCTQAGNNCFCTSLGTGPRATGDYDLALTELLEDGGHRFYVECGTKKGEDILKDLPAREATENDAATAARVSDVAAMGIRKTVEMNGLKDILHEASEHPRWDDVARRCLACGNCTLVCPTCFCTTVEDVTTLRGEEASRVRRWDSCFTLDFSYIHGGSVRQTPKARYRQWMTHKLASWSDQFGKPGCTGCGRCITWCPVGIDLTEEAAAIRNRAFVKEVVDGDD